MLCCVFISSLLFLDDVLFVVVTAAEATPQNGVSRVTPSRTFVVPSPTSQSPGVDDDLRKDDENAKQLATPGESKCNNNEHVNNSLHA